MGPEEEGKVEAGPGPRPKTCSYEKTDGDRCHKPSIEGSAEGLCLFHEPVGGKDDDACTRAFLKAVDGGEHDFEGYQLADADLSGKVFHSDMIFRRAAFTGRTSFREANFTEYAFFQDATFKGGLDMGSVRFSNDVSFEGATLRGDAIFEGDHFDKS